MHAPLQNEKAEVQEFDERDRSVQVECIDLIRGSRLLTWTLSADARYLKLEHEKAVEKSKTTTLVP